MQKKRKADSHMIGNNHGVPWGPGPLEVPMVLVVLRLHLFLDFQLIP